MSTFGKSVVQGAVPIHRIRRCAHRPEAIDRLDREAIMPTMARRNGLEAAREGAERK
jgi:hypothetical protein